MTFEGHRVLVTGAAGGVGRATTDAFRRQGASVCVADLDCSGLDAEAAVPGDLTEMAYADTLAGAAAAALGGFDIVVNNAGFMTCGAVTTTSDDDLARALAVNVEAPLRISRAAVPVFAAAGAGAIFQTAIAVGKFHGLTTATMPTGSRRTSISISGRTESALSPIWRSTSAA